MATLKLTKLEIQDLINRYQSELKKLEFQIEKTAATITDLEKALGNAGNGIATSSKTSASGKKRGRPRKIETAVATVIEAPKKRRGRPRKTIAAATV